MPGRRAKAAGASRASESTVVGAQPTSLKTVAGHELKRCAVTNLSSREVYAVSNLLAGAFQDDPVLAWLFPNSVHRSERLQALFARDIRFKHPATQVLLEKEARAVVFWQPPWTWAPSRVAIRMAPALLTRRGRQGLRLQRKVERVHPTDGHWHLTNLAVLQSIRNTGVGAALTVAGLDLADHSGRAAYVETTSSVGAAWFHRYGFLHHASVAQTGAPTIRTLWRHPEGRVLA